MMLAISSEMSPGPALTSEAETVDRVWVVFLIGAVAVSALVIVLTLYCVVRYRRRDDRLPKQTRQHIPTEIAYTGVPLLIVIALFVVTFVTTKQVNHVEAAEPDLVVEVTGFQWNWSFAYPDLGVTTTGTQRERAELVLPSDSRVRFELTSADVIHSFWIPGFRYKRDLFPDEVTEFDVDVLDIIGTYSDSGVCAEYCGLDHAYMRFDVRIMPPDEFDAWAADQAAAATS